MPAHASPLVRRHCTPYREPDLTYSLGCWGPT